MSSRVRVWSHVEPRHGRRSSASDPGAVCPSYSVPVPQRQRSWMPYVPYPQPDEEGAPSAGNNRQKERPGFVTPKVID